MQVFSIEHTDIEGLKVINPFISKDERGYFCKFFEKNFFIENGIELGDSEDLQSCSKKGVIRGLHFQVKKPQSKLIRVIVGKIFQVSVDLRKDSKTFGQWRSFILSDQNFKQIFVPKGFAAGIMALSDIAIISYKCSGAYYKEYDSGIMWNDKKINIDWPLNKVDKVIISEKDKSLPTFSEYISGKFGLLIR